MSKKRYTMTPSELREISLEKKHMENQLNKIESGVGRGTAASQIDKSKLKKEIKYYDKVLHKSKPRKLDGRTKDKMHNRSKELEKQIKEGMPNRDEMRDLKRHPGAPTKNLRWEKRNAKKIKEYKQIQRNLNPQNPDASSIEHLRR